MVNMFVDRPRCSRWARGFTMIEALVVVAIVAILASIAYPSMQDLMKASRLRGASSDFYSDLLAARSEAIKRRTNVSVSPSGGTWTGGWSVTFAASTLRNHEPLAGDIQVQVNIPAAPASPITYGSNGRPTCLPASCVRTTVIFYVTGTPGAQARCIGISPSGLPNIRTDTNNNATDGCN